ncbi:unnamed protein product [Angiostrongylus costaricensis]|uniref:UDENN domain-containing protein n=1 Tax=Angiostrongylus costaricensis TaxID=334426 RepID=A0A0R3PJK3_ANGCS|nr:unnamed protein product [Angiostrongylus costaricensis]
MCDDEAFGQSQDVLATLTHQQVGLVGSREPWKREFNCSAVPLSTAVEPPAHHSGSSSNSHELPSLREEYADFAQLVVWPYSDLRSSFVQVATSRGIQFLFGRLFKFPVPFQNFPFHAALFAWSFACRLFEVKSYLPAENTSRLTADDAFVVLLDGLAVFKQNIGCSISCSCVHSVLLELYKTMSSKLLKCSFRIVECLTNDEFPYSSSEFGTLGTTPVNFLGFFADVISHLIDFRIIRFMAHVVSKVHFNSASNGKFASKFVTKILQTVEVAELPDLEKLSRGDSSRWAESVMNSFRSCVSEELLLIDFLLRILSDEQLSSCRGIVINRYANSKLLVKGCVLSSTLSMLLALVGGVNDKFWICFIPSYQTMNVLPLPERSRVFATRYLVMVQSYPKELYDVDINRFVMAASTSELLEFFYLFTNVQREVPGSIWDKATNLLFTTRPNDSKLQAFVVNQLVVGIQARSSCSLSRFKFTLERFSCPIPDAGFLFIFSNSILTQLQGEFRHIISQLVPLWIYAVLAYSSSREMDTKRFTSLIWDHISQLLISLAPNFCMELSPGNLELFVVRFFTVLGGTTSSADVVRKIVADSVPLFLATQIATLLKSDDKELEERILRLCAEMFTHVGSVLLAIAETEAQRIGLNRTSFVVLVQALVTKLVKSSMDPVFLLQVAPVYIAALLKLPYRMFIYSRVKDLLLKFADESAIALRISDELTKCHGLAYHKQLVKESDPRIKKFFGIDGMM